MINRFWLIIPSHSRMLTLAAGIFLLFYTGFSSAQSFDQAVALQQAVLSPYKNQIRSRLEMNQSIVELIFKQLRQHSLPNQLVLLPMLESSFNAEATSYAGARGLWQLMPDTAERFGLAMKPDDQRLNIDASTRAALNYLQFLHNKFNGNLTLTLAAYNAGEGRVDRAVQEAGTEEFHQLKLPRETRQYVHRFYALANLIDVSSLSQHSFAPLMLFTNETLDAHQPLINLAPLPPLVEL